jgi:FkbM family methyltransferase
MKTPLADIMPFATAEWGANAGLYFSQFGEDCFLWSRFAGQWDGFYVDIGCHDPYRYSNTCLLHTFRRWRGLNVDADPAAIERFRAARPGDINVHAGVGLTAGERTLALFKDGAVNTFDPALKAQQLRHYELDREVQVPILPLRDLLDRHLPPGTAIDVLNIDCEGIDDEVVASNDWERYPARVVLVEIHSFDPRNPPASPTFRRMLELGYVLRAHYYATSIFEKLD